MARRINRDLRYKIRNVPRRLRALDSWAKKFEGWFPENINEYEKNVYWSIPVEENLVIGKYSTTKIKAACAQSLINACSNLINAKPLNLEGVRVTCVICLPDMFISKVCIYTNNHTFNTGGSEKINEDNSLAKRWGLILPNNVKEIGLHVGPDEFSPFYEYWYYGEVD